jgi:transketolase
MRKTALSVIETLMEQNESIVFIGSDLGAGTMVNAKLRFPSRVFMEGISEQHIVGFAAGLALEGFIPFVHTIGTFLTRRALEQIIVDVALQNLPVKLVASGGGMVYAPLGPTHQSIDDFAIMGAIPNMVISAPADPKEMSDVIQIISNQSGPAYIRVAKGGEPNITTDLEKLQFSKIRPIIPGSSIAVITTGVMLHECLTAFENLSSLESMPALFHVPFIQPIDDFSIRAISEKFQSILIVEEHLPNGGLFSKIAEILIKGKSHSQVSQLSLKNDYASNYGTQKDHWELAKLDGLSIARHIVSMMSIRREQNG